MKGKKINSRLFDSEIFEEQLENVNGGAQKWTSKHDDTSMDTGNSDIFFGTYDEEGESNTLDTFDTGSGTKDKPL